LSAEDVLEYVAEHWYEGIKKAGSGPALKEAIQEFNKSKPWWKTLLK